jgi:hypothetical protein
VIDPISAFAAATAAFNAVKRGVELGQEIEGIASQLGKWFSACADLNKADEEANNPSLFKQIVHKESVEQEALEALIRRKKIEEQETELRTMIVYRFGIEAYRDMIEERQKITTRRKRQEHLQAQKRKSVVINTILGASIIFLAYLIWAIADVVYSLMQGAEL